MKYMQGIKMNNYQDFCQTITKQLFDLIDTKGSLLSWHKRWESKGSKQLPIGSNGLYHSSNLFMLLMAQFETGFQSNHWLTFNQIKQKGGCVKKGAQGRKVIFWKLNEVKGVKDNGDTEEKIIPIFKTYYVFNLEQTTLDLPVSVDPVFQQSAIDALVTRLGVSVSHFGNSALYNKLDDVIVMPYLKSFTSVENYYATLLHEICHFTGHSTRLPRPCFDDYGKCEKARAQEELIAEIGSVFLSAHFGLKAELENHASYIQSWKTLLNEKEIASAISKAARVFEWILLAASEKQKVAA